MQHGAFRTSLEVLISSCGPLFAIPFSPFDRLILSLISVCSSLPVSPTLFLLLFCIYHVFQLLPAFSLLLRSKLLLRCSSGSSCLGGKSICHNLSVAHETKLWLLGSASSAFEGILAGLDQLGNRLACFPRLPKMSVWHPGHTDVQRKAWLADSNLPTMEVHRPLFGRLGNLPFEGSLCTSMLVEV